MTVTEDMAEVLPDPSTQLVFITTSHDTRFDASGVIRPCSAATAETETSRHRHKRKHS